MAHERAEDISAVKEVREREQRVSSPSHAKHGAGMFLKDRELTSMHHAAAERAVRKWKAFTMRRR